MIRKKVFKIKRVKLPYIIHMNFQVSRTGENPTRMRKVRPLWALNPGKVAQGLLKKATAQL